jgi:WD40 repeat protein
MRRLRSFLSALKPTRFGVLFAVLVGLGVGFWQWNRSPRPRVLLENLGPDLTAIFSPDGRMLATHYRKTQLEGPSSCVLTLWDVDTGRKKNDLFKGPFHLLGVAFSPDGSKVGYCVESQVHLWDIPQEMELTYENNENKWYSQPVFSSQGKLLALRAGLFWDVAENKLVKKLILERENALASGPGVLLVQTKDKIKIWDLATATSMEISDPPLRTGIILNVKLSSDRRFLISHVSHGWPPMSPTSIFIRDLATGQNHVYPAKNPPPGPWESHRTGGDITPDGKTAAWGIGSPNIRYAPQATWSSWFMDWLGIQQRPSSNLSVSLNAIPSGDEIAVLNDCSCPVISPDGKTLAVTSADNASLQLYDLPIRKPIGKILGFAGLAAVATLLAINGLGWLRRRRLAYSRRLDSPGAKG